MTEEDEHLRLLKIGHYVLGGFGIVFACLPLLHFGVGIMLLLGMVPDYPSPRYAGWMFAIAGGLFFLLGQACAISVIISGRFIAKRKNYLFSIILAGLLCTFAPFGTVLGIFTFIVLHKDPVKRLYGKI